MSPNVVGLLGAIAQEQLWNDPPAHNLQKFALSATNRKELAVLSRARRFPPPWTAMKGNDVWEDVTILGRQRGLCCDARHRHFRRSDFTFIEDLEVGQPLRNHEEDQMPLTHLSQPRPKPKHNHADEGKSRTATTDSSFFIVVAFSLIGLLIALNFIFRFPDLGALIAEYNQF
jgi:hypothetical protein